MFRSAMDVWEQPGVAHVHDRLRSPSSRVSAAMSSSRVSKRARRPVERCSTRPANVALPGPLSRRSWSTNAFVLGSSSTVLVSGTR